jgi:hypothetical protein
MLKKSRAFGSGKGMEMKSEARREVGQGCTEHEFKN